MSKGGKQPAATTQTTTTEFPSELRPYITDILERSKARAEAEEKAGYQAYTGPRIAGFDPSQLAAQAKTEGVVAGGVSADPLLSSAQTYYAPALGLTLGQAERFGPSQAASYMSPYQQAVVDVEKREAARGFAPQLQDIRAKSVSAGGFGGSRGALLESDAMRNQGQLLSDIQTRGSQSAYQQAQAAFEAQKSRERGAAGGLAAMGAAIPGQAFKEIGALEAMGAGRRADAQRALDLGYSQFQEEQLFPTKTLQEYQSIVRGFPYTPNTYTSGFTTTPPSSMAQNILGVGTGIAGLAGAFGGFGAKEGGHMAKLKRGRTPEDAPISEAYKNQNVTSAAFPLASMFQSFFSSDDEDKPEYKFKEGEVRTAQDIRGRPNNFKYVGGKFYKIKEDGSLAKDATSDSNFMIQNIKNVSPTGEAESRIVATETKPIVQTEAQDISTLVRDLIPGGAEPDDTKKVIKPSTVATDNMAALAAKAKTDVKTASTATDTGMPSDAMDSPTEDINKAININQSNLLQKDLTKKDMKSGLSGFDDLITKLTDRKTITPEMQEYKDELKTLRADLGKRESKKKEELKKQKYLQLAQFGLNVLAGDTTKGDLQIIGEAGKEPLSNLGKIVSEEAKLGDETTAAKLEMLGKEAGVAEAQQTAERQKFTDTVALRKAINDEVNTKIKLGEWDSSIGLSAAEENAIRSDIFGARNTSLLQSDKQTLMHEADAKADLEFIKILNSPQGYDFRSNPFKANQLQKQLRTQAYQDLIKSGQINIGKDSSTLGAEAAAAGNQNQTADEAMKNSDSYLTVTPDGR